jgi:hypothetical protein
MGTIIILENNSFLVYGEEQCSSKTMMADAMALLTTQSPSALFNAAKDFLTNCKQQQLQQCILGSGYYDCKYYDSKQQQSVNANSRIEFNSTSTICINDKPCVTTICINNQPCRTFTANSTNTGNSTNNPNSIILPPQQTF